MDLLKLDSEPLKWLHATLNIGGFWLNFSDRNKKRMFGHIIQNIVLYFFLSYDLILIYVDGVANIDIDKFIYLPPFIINSILHATLFFKQNSIKHLLKKLNEIMESNEEDRKKFIKRYKFVKKLIKTYVTIQITVWSCVFIVPLLQSIASLFYSEDFKIMLLSPLQRIMGFSPGPLQDWVLLICTILWTFNLMCTFFSTFASVDLILIFCYLEIKLFHYQIETYYTASLRKDIDYTYRTLIRRQVEISTLFEALKDAIGLYLGLQNTFIAITICSSLYAATTVESLYVILLFIYGTLLFIFNSFLCCYISDLMETEGSNICNSIYELPWYEMRPQERKTFQMFILKASQSMKMNYKGVFPTNLDTFSQIMQASYSYFMLLQQFS